MFRIGLTKSCNKIQLYIHTRARSVHTLMNMIWNASTIIMNKNTTAQLSDRFGQKPLRRVMVSLMRPLG